MAQAPQRARAAITAFNGTNGCSAISTLTVRDTGGVDPQMPANGHRLSFTAIDPANSGRHRIRVVNSSGSALTFTISASDTTMYSATWTTNGTYDIFYSFQNTTNATCNIALTMRDTGGTVRTTFSGPVATGATIATNTQALATPRSTTGTATLTHDCPPNAINIEAAVANFTFSPTPYFQTVKFTQLRAAH